VNVNIVQDGIKIVCMKCGYI